MLIVDILKKKRDGKPLESNEVKAFIQGVQEKKVGNEQVASFLTSAFIHGLNPKETAALTFEMMNSGKVFDNSDKIFPVIDKHSTGGVGDKTSIILVPLLMCYDVYVPMISGRGLGHTGGTVDKLTSIPGFKMDYSFEELNSLLKDNRVFMSGQTDDLAPADRKFYHIRDITGTVESVGLITSSILSKKFAEGLKGLVIDMKVGTGAFMKDIKQAHQLANYMINVAEEMSIDMTIVFSNMNEPIGYSVGNFNEVLESEKFLLGKSEIKQQDLTLTLAEEMLRLAKINATKDDLLKKIKSGEAHKNFHKMIFQQGGDYTKAVEKNKDAFKIEFLSDTDGVINHINPLKIGNLGIEINVGRKNITDNVDGFAGFNFLKKVGNKVKAGEPILEIQSSTPIDLNLIKTKLKDAIKISDKEFKSEEIIIDIWR